MDLKKEFSDMISPPLKRDETALVNLLFSV